jgi:hypothetical protein
LPLDPNALLVNSRVLADRWGVCERTVIRICRENRIAEIQLRPGGRLLFDRDAVEEFEAEAFHWN